MKNNTQSQNPFGYTKPVAKSVYGLHLTFLIFQDPLQIIEQAKLLLGTPGWVEYTIGIVLEALDRLQEP